MINLLPTVIKEDIRAARSNVIIVRYMSIVALAFLFIGLILFTSYGVLMSTETTAEERIASNETNVQASSVSETKRQVDALTTELNDARPILDQEVRFSQVLVQLGQIMPGGTVLGETTFTTENFNGAPLEITAYAKTSAEVSLLQSQLQSSPLFSQVSVNSTENDNGIDDYPVVVKLSVTLNRTGA